MTITTGKHFVVFPMQMWGHTRTMCTLVARMAKLRNVTITFFIISGFYDRVMAEISREFLPGEEYLSARIRVVALQHNKSVAITKDVEAAFEAAYVKMCNGEPLTCAKTGKEIPVHPMRVSVAIIDMFIPDAFEAVRKHTPDTVKVFVWVPVATHSFFFYWAEDHVDSVEASAAQRGISFEEAAREIVQPSGKVMRSPLTGAIYDYELQPQAFPLWFSGTLLKIARVMQTAHGMLTFDAAEYDPKTAKALKAWFGKSSRKAYYAGPLIPQGTENTSSDPRADIIRKFLDEKLALYGKHSVVYVSFGSLFWPTDTNKLWAVLEVLMERNIPFVMSCAAEFASGIPETLQDKIAQFGHAIVAEWVPQQALLDHPATGWYLSHGGHNSTIESIMAGVPAIVWPISADQPVNAIYLSEDLDVAYELIEVRNGTGLGKLLRNGRVPVGTIVAVKAEMNNVLSSAFGEDGARKRAKLQSLRKILQASWNEEGVARREVEEFLDDL
ncbi:UDP-Glycosyltransferase/glycogen phosphorylase [Dichomitus squalens LYAD-421 SS1]|uniref:UDP-Glycosyltransferase/glycogen phosphorylase n=1 Tax=Dichomitus squalens (strain LYAD-421) TaxID=732165 RepID=R7SS90_DICSQ|nr:UDP-Glycosyltransferase/glycogen phosphorylase [Dichomitus squalens LYAD-421 SS1]EJF59059.1 UDP-Glycosyltransferase/glycogen phosphorylase [Dichomitus squalens LYAD-421 SS1]